MKLCAIVRDATDHLKGQFRLWPNRHDWLAHVME